MINILFKIVRRFYPEIDEAPDMMKRAIIVEFFHVLYLLPFVVVGLIWLMLETDLTVFEGHWLTIVVLAGAYLFINYYDFYMTISVNQYQLSLMGTMASIISFSGLFIFGPTAIWIPVLMGTVLFIREWILMKYMSIGRLVAFQSFFNRVAQVTVAGLLVLTFYESIDGAYPLTGMDSETLLPALATTVVYLLISNIMTLPDVIFTFMYLVRNPEGRDFGMPLLILSGISSVLPLFQDPFAVLAAALYGSDRLLPFGLFILGIGLVAYLTNRLSRIATSNQGRTREMSLLEQLGRDIINSPPDAVELSALLKQYVPQMFPGAYIHIRMYPDNDLLISRLIPGDSVEETLWDWLKTQSEGQAFKSGEGLPWSQEKQSHARLVIPVMDSDTREVIGGIYMAVLQRSAPVKMMPALQSLADQIASVRHREQVYQQTLSYQRDQQELAFAAQVQNSFLPSELPGAENWQFDARLDPARHTSGDFYDMFALPDNRIGMVVADVADKGTGAALFMALSRTLIRTYAREYPDQPEVALQVANRRILEDTRNDLFVTLFYGVLDVETGMLTWANAGHNPAYLYSSGEIQSLTKTGIPLGIFDMTWKQNQVQLKPGDVLVIYTDGVTEAQNSDDDLYGDDRLLTIIQDGSGQLTAAEISQRIVDDVQEFVGGAPQADDITLMVITQPVMAPESESAN